MIDTVKYQLERAVDALRTALKLGASNEDGYLLRNISDAITDIEGWQTSLRFNETKSEPEVSDPAWDEIQKRVSKRGGFTWNNKTQFVPAKPENTSNDFFVSSQPPIAYYTAGGTEGVVATGNDVVTFS
jgi:hypothetical protein